jgi:hypothetical protein
MQSFVHFVLFLGMFFARLLGSTLAQPSCSFMLFTPTDSLKNGENVEILWNVDTFTEPGCWLGLFELNLLKATPNVFDAQKVATLASGMDVMNSISVQVVVPSVPTGDYFLQFGKPGNFMYSALFFIENTGVSEATMTIEGATTTIEGMSTLSQSSETTHSTQFTQSTQTTKASQASQTTQITQDTVDTQASGTPRTSQIPSVAESWFQVGLLWMIVIA